MTAMCLAFGADLPSAFNERRIAVDKETFSFRLDCASDAVTPKALSQSVTIFTKMLAEANASDWRISRMELHSVDLAAQPIVSDAAAEESFAVLEVIARLATDNAVSRERASRFATILGTSLVRGL